MLPERVGLAFCDASFVDEKMFVQFQPLARIHRPQNSTRFKSMMPLLCEARLQQDTVESLGNFEIDIGWSEPCWTRPRTAQS